MKNNIKNKKKELIIDENTFVISDNHFRHKNIMTFEPSRMTKMMIEGHENFDNCMIEEWNSVVTNKDSVLNLGDLDLGKMNEEFYQLKNLNGNKFLLKGNHDNLTTKKYNDIGFEVIGMQGLILDKELLDNSLLMKEIKKIKQNIERQLKLFHFIIKTVNNKRIMFTHFPIVNNIGYDGKYEYITNKLKTIFDLTNCDVNIHGHTHSKEIKENFLINVSIEKINFKPIRIKDII